MTNTARNKQTNGNKDVKYGRWETERCRKVLEKRYRMAWICNGGEKEGKDLTLKRNKDKHKKRSKRE